MGFINDDFILGSSTAREVFEECNAKLATEEFRGQALIKRFNVEVVCTTDDPADDLHWHKMIAAHPFGVKVLPAWRPDKAMAIENPKAYKAYLKKLGETVGKDIDSYQDLQEVLQRRHNYFESMGCRLSDHGMDTFYAADYKPVEIEIIFKKVLLGKVPTPKEIEKFRSAFLFDQAVMDARSGCVQQFPRPATASICLTPRSPSGSRRTSRKCKTALLLQRGRFAYTLPSIYPAGRLRSRRDRDGGWRCGRGYLR